MTTTLSSVQFFESVTITSTSMGGVSNLINKHIGTTTADKWQFHHCFEQSYRAAPLPRTVETPRLHHTADLRQLHTPVQLVVLPDCFSTATQEQ